MSSASVLLKTQETASTSQELVGKLKANWENDAAGLQCGTHDPSRCIFCFRCYHCGPPQESLSKDKFWEFLETVRNTNQIGKQSSWVLYTTHQGDHTCQALAVFSAFSAGHWGNGTIHGCFSPTFSISSTAQVELRPGWACPWCIIHAVPRKGKYCNDAIVRLGQNPSYAARTLGWDRVMRDDWWKQHKQSVSKYKATCFLHCRKHTFMLYRTWCRMVWIQRRGIAAAWLALTACLRNIRYHKFQLHFDQSDWFSLTVIYITCIIHGNNIHGKYTNSAHNMYVYIYILWR